MQNILIIVPLAIVLNVGMGAIFILIAIFGAGLGVFIFFLIRSIITPQKISHVADFIKQKRYGQAIKVAKQILTKDHRNIEAHYLLGQAYDKSGKPELALMEYKAVNNISDFKGYCQEVPFRRDIARLFTQFNYPEEALKEYLLLIQLDSENADNFYNAGMLFQERSRSKQAANYYKKAIDVDPTHSDAHFRLGEMLFLARRYNDAQTILQKALKLNPENHKINYYLGKMYKQVKDYATAVTFFEKSQKDNDFKVKSIIEKGSCFIASGNIQQARQEFERAVKQADERNKTKPKQKDRLFAHYMLGYCLENLREIDQAIDHWEVIYTEDPNFKDVAEKLSRYQDLRSDDRVKDYMTMGSEMFQDICREITESMGLSVNDIAATSNGCQIIAIEQESAQWRNARKVPRLIRFLRTADNIEVETVRSFQEEMKRMSVNRGVIVSSANFSRSALEFCESRPIELIGREDLQKLLSSS